MGREIRRVPLEFKHPDNAYGNPNPMLGTPLSEADAEWERGRAEHITEFGTDDGFEEDHGPKPSTDPEESLCYTPDGWPVCNCRPG